MEQTISGEIDFLNQQVAFSVLSSEAEDGALERELIFQRTPLRPTELLELMQVIAPAPSRDSLKSTTDGIKADMTQVLINSNMPHDMARTRHHRSAFKDHWQVLSGQAQELYDALPFRFNGQMYFSYGNPSLKNLIGKIKDIETRDTYFRMLRRDEPLASLVTVNSWDNVELPDTPFVQITDDKGDPTFFRTQNMRQEDGVLVQRTKGFSADGLGTALFTNNQNGGCVPIWETDHIPNIGVVPVIRWQVALDGTAHFVHPETQQQTVEHDGIIWEATASSVVGAVALAAICPEVRENWRRRQGYYENAKKTQRMGPLQATLLAVMHADETLTTPFVTHINDQLQRV